MSRTIIACLALAACTATTLPPPSVETTEPLSGHWRIVEIDGRTPTMVEEDAGEPRTPRFWFGDRSYGGTSGCNFLGGLNVERSGRLFTYPGPQTQMGCGGALGEQEGAIDGLFRAAPTIARSGEAAVLSGGGHTMRLVADIGGTPAEDPPEAWQGAGVANQRFELHQFDGDSLNRRPAPKLVFGDGSATLTGLCPTPIAGPFQELRGGLRLAFAAPCAAAAKYFSETLSTVSGPNGELLLAGESHWIAGDNQRRDRPK